MRCLGDSEKKRNICARLNDFDAEKYYDRNCREPVWQTLTMLLSMLRLTLPTMQQQAGISTEVALESTSSPTSTIVYNCCHLEVLSRMRA